MSELIHELEILISVWEADARRYDKTGWNSGLAEECRKHASQLRAMLVYWKEEANT